MYIYYTLNGYKAVQAPKDLERNVEFRVMGEKDANITKAEDRDEGQ